MYIAGMDEGGGGFPHNNINHIFKSTDGGNTWSHPYTGPAFAGPGVTRCGFLCLHVSRWRWSTGATRAGVSLLPTTTWFTWSMPSTAPAVTLATSITSVPRTAVSTFSAPFKLNSDATARPQWQPNISVSPTGTLLATWYDARESASCTLGSAGVPCYRMWSRKSNDNGATWLPDDAFSDVVSPLPAQPDPGIQATYAGDYDYGSATTTKHVTSWTDGRVAIGGSSQQDAFTDRELAGFGVTTTTPACNSVINTQPTDFVMNLSDPVNT